LAGGEAQPPYRVSLPLCDACQYQFHNT
jgi:hypothetical protein